MTKKKLSAGAAVVKEWLAADGAELREVVRAWLTRLPLLSFPQSSSGNPLPASPLDAR